MALGDDIKVGYYVVVSYAGALIGAQRNATLKMDQEVIDITSKDSEWWKEHFAGFRTWSVDCDGLLLPADAGQAALVTALLYTGDTPTAPVNISFYSGSTLAFSGTATIKSIEIGAPYQEAGTFKASFEGVGPLTGTF